MKRSCLRPRQRGADSSLAGGRLKLESVWATFDRYASIVRSAVTGIEALPDMDQRGAAS
jgi:hypothetical protein